MLFRTNLKGSALLNTPRLNKGAGFTREERQIFGLEGFLPYDVHSLEKQALRAYNQLCKQPSVILKHAFLASLRDQNQVLFYKLMQDRLKELLGVLYTPGAAEAVAGYSSLFRRPVGCYILQGHLSDINRTADVAYDSQNPNDAIDLVVVTDSEAILGIGDQGVGGITISTSKAALYTLGAGINPNRILPVVLDCGTDNHALFSDSLYMGWKRTRIRGKNYDKYIDRFIANCRELFPNAIIHFEDFGMANAYRLMEKYKDIPMFNDDIQGTGAVALAALLSAIKVSGSSLADQRIVIYGAGSAGMGIADQIKDGLQILNGLSPSEAAKRFWCVDRHGLLVQSQGNALRHSQLPYARPDAEVQNWSKEDEEREGYWLMDVIKNVKPTVLIGTSTHSRAFNEELIREMGKHVERPIIFPMSNPTALCEVDPTDALAWTEGRALVATGSPFPPVPLADGKEYVVAQTNNALIYPALGLGAILSRSKTISNSMLMAGVNSLASLSPALSNPEASLLPDLADVRKVSVDVAAAVVRQAVEDGNAYDEVTIKYATGKGESSLEDYIRSRMWDAVYRPLELVD
ncbi:malate dehydrogenase (oxaloacetate-decarboxylating) [Cryptococcus wingfieldii CBS 7118]|uniref:Malic enzyme n=1 Tax=Cryptococcus wingfieldii CBS 7118 TaxID=1295528 RepID=A0A1E3ISJ4_9TREE|nr:malate dehydrogenase (oxaloacetate-decarboxylating) [Cryptococcus wingfieldii CBS 7118]ODN91425.1 malate dehydrogenase (oxaloacetate-decarboxylating) [Cryptococcus wingfieldii CBS 7118]